MQWMMAFILAWGLLVPVGAEKISAVQWKPFNAGIKSAAASGKYVFVDIWADWCGYCHKLDQVTFKASPVISELGKNFVSVKLNAEGSETVSWKGQKMVERELAGLWGVEGLPTLIFISPKGEVIGSFSSYAEPELMVKLLTYISSGAREAKVKFDDYVKGGG